ncbi:hypothetical protein SOVF_020720 [Spinacia oleracea]|uniref:6.7 kDa chloroplast outer envelope membrane protein n=1 Tax=Spinacia oleracea TaxID=3562 RepID=OEC6_SPIOL|nr:RecName: Full=6.7 kDa chloroplast outer envelope membrane protein; AltName: Full=E 6.7 [Spinacia oleracea]AAA34034.1 6.7 kDa chloroplast outer envelope membrane protein [Spinacia oleracea]AAA34035.1 6.7 kDa chloroplast outer envelope membrane protein [Spinacia oleracea]KNA23850.1 hypothetical protein SOVF_020720 [Spinacia oleracea]
MESVAKPATTKEGSAKQAAIVVGVLALGWFAIQVAFIPLFNKVRGGGSDKKDDDVNAFTPDT